MTNTREFYHIENIEKSQMHIEKTMLAMCLCANAYVVYVVNKIQYALLFLLFFSLTNITIAQESDLRIGQWKSHLPYQSGRWVTQSETQIYYASPFSIFTIDKADNSVEFLSKVEGLSDVGVDKINYNQSIETLVIAYVNSNIDLVKPDGIVNLNDILKNTNIVGDRAIYNILFEGTAAYLSTGFGIVKLNLEREEFEFTTFTGLPVFDMTLFNGRFYAATDEGVYEAINAENVNLADFNNWRLLDVPDGFPAVYSSAALATHHNRLYLDINGELFQYDGDNLESVYQEEGFHIQFLEEGTEHLITGFSRDVDGNGLVFFFREDGGFTTSGGVCVNRPRNAIELTNGQIWYADVFRGIRFVNTPGERCTSRNFNSPHSHNNSEIALDGDKVYVASGGIRTNQTALNRVEGVFILEDGQWSRFHRDNVPLFFEKSIDRDFYRLAVHPEDGRLFAGTFWGGLVEYDGENFIAHTEENSSLQGAAGDEARERVSGLAFDEDNNLWISNHFAPRPISVLKNDGTWRNFSAPATGLLEVAVDNNGYKWFVAANEGVLVFDDNGTIDDTSDDRMKLFTPSNSELQTRLINCLEVDLDGDVWVGTAEGIVVFQCGTGVFNNDNRCGNRILVEQDGFGAFLLETENVQTIAVDGANRKWIGTTNGLFIQSENGDEQVAFFNTTNSPLFDNTVIDVAINQETGEAFIGTNNGILSLRGDAVGGNRINSPSAYAFPNPVRPDYTGPIAIKGLARDANVKITDVSGRLIFETTALGGQAIWDGKSFDGRRASTGVYLVFSTASRGLTTPNSVVAKILFIN